jgi:hypothetical protein
MVNKTIDDLIVKNLARLRDNVKAYFGSTDTFSIEYDAANTGHLVITHEPSASTWEFGDTGELIATQVNATQLNGPLTSANQVNDVFGGSGTPVVLWAGSARSNTTTTNTTYPAGPDIQISTVPFPYNTPENATVKVEWSGLLQNDTTGEDVSAILYDIDGAVDLTATEVTHTGTTFTAVASPLEAYNPSTVGRLGLKLKVTAGTGTVDRVSARVVAEIN